MYTFIYIFTPVSSHLHSPTSSGFFLFSSSSNSTVHSHKQLPLLTQPGYQDETDTELPLSTNAAAEQSTHPALLKQIERMLHKASKQTSEHITNSLTKEIRELGTCTAALDYMTELENIKKKT